MIRSTVAAGKGQLLKASTRAVPLGNAADMTEPAVVEHHVVVPKGRFHNLGHIKCPFFHSNFKAVPQTSYTMSKTLSSNGVNVPAAINGLSTPSQARYMSSLVKTTHNDMEVPDFSYYRRSGTRDSTKDSKESEAARKNFTYMLAGATGVAGIYSAHKFVNVFLGQLSASRDVLAMAKIEVELSSIPVGKNMTFKWRGKPLFIRRRYIIFCVIFKGLVLRLTF